MPKLDFDGLKATLHAYIYGTVSTWLPGGRKEANEYLVENPTRDDHKKGSFRVNLRTGQWADFATGDKGGDLISLYAYLKGVKMGEAYKMLTGGNVESLEVKKRHAEAKKKAVPEEHFTAMPIPDDAPPVPAYKGKPERVTEYRDEDGKFIFRVCQYRQKNGNKIPMPTSWGRRVWPKMREDADGKEVYAGEMHDRVGWHNKWIPDNRPLMNLDLLAQNPDAVVLLGEGEKVAARLNSLGLPYIGMTWSGGCERWRQSEWRTLSQRTVILCPDYDLPGQKAMLEIAHILKGMRCKVRVVWEPLDEARHESGWDLADEKDDAKVREAIENALDLEVVENIVAEAAKVNAGKGSYADLHGGALHDSLPAEVLANQKELRCLGYGGDNKVYFICRTRGVVTALSPDMLGNKNHLFSLMEKKFWYDLFPDAKGGMDKDACSDVLQRWADRTGYFNPEVVRGSGVWPETNGDFVFHMGQRLLVKDKQVPINEYHSEYMYEATNDLGMKFVKPLPTDQSRQLLELSQWLEWELPVFAHLLAGFCVVAPMCGGLDWRPHIWVTGSAGTGKSTVMKELVKRSCGRVCLFVQGDSTSAGIRQKLGSDALPVVFDEFEGETPQRLLELQRILDLARQSSSETGAMMLKGGAMGDPLEFKIRSCFAYSSINVNLTHFADKSRVSVLTLKDPPKELTEAQRNERYATFEAYMHRLDTVLTPDFVNALLMRSYALLPIIRANAKVFGRAINAKLNSRRLGDQLGILCAGSWSLTSSKPVTDAEAEAWCSQFDFEKAAPVDDANDHDRCLAYILQSVVKFQTARGPVERTMGELVEVVMKNDLEGDDPNEARRVLLRHGLKIERNSKVLMIANNHTQLEKVMARTPYQAWATLLKRIDGAYPSEKPERFGATDKPSRATCFKLDVLMQMQQEPAKKVMVAEF